MRGSLPIQLSTFVGRSAELSALRQLLNGTRLVTLTGAAGSGKTRLALRLGDELQSRYPDGTWFIELASVADPARVPEAVATVLGVQEEVGRPLIDTLVDHQRARCSLLLLDNCEHLLDACAGLVGALLSSSPSLRVVTTSREPLHLAGEAVWPVPPLSLPRIGEGAAEIDVMRSEAVRLFVERAALIRSAFELTSRTAPVVARICERLDGMPLAIELAAARLRVLSVYEIESRLGRRFRLLTGGSLTALQRQQTLWAAIDWSYQLLDPEDRWLLDRLAIFAGGFTLESAGAVCSGDRIAADGMLDGLGRLVDKSMLIADETVDGSTRYRLLETLRAYGLDRLESSGTFERLGEAHASHFLAMSLGAEAHITGPDQMLWLRRLRRELDNLRAALRWWQGHEPGRHLLMASALAMFWYMQGHLTEGRQQLEAALAGTSDSRLRAMGLYGLGLLEHRHAEYDRAQSHFETARVLFRAVGDERGAGRSLMRSGKTAFELGDLVAAEERLQEAHGVLSALGDRWAVAQTLHDLGVLYGEHGLGDHDRSIARFREALAMRRDLGDRHATAFTLFAYSAEPGSIEVRRAFLHEAIQIYREMGDGVGIGVGLENASALASVGGRHQRAVKLLAAAQAQRRRSGGASPQRMRVWVEELVAASCRRLSEADAARLTEDGRGLSVEEAIGLATEDWEAATVKRMEDRQSADARLTRRELEVAGLVAKGLTNREIASRLFVSPRTAEYHVEQIRNKLGFHSRAQVAAWSATTQSRTRPI